MSFEALCGLTQTTSSILKSQVALFTAGVSCLHITFLHPLLCPSFFFTCDLASLLWNFQVENSELKVKTCTIMNYIELKFFNFLAACVTCGLSKESSEVTAFDWIAHIL